MSNLISCNGRKWQAPLLAPQELVTITPERFANLFFKLPMNNKALGLNEFRMLLTQCFISMLIDHWHDCTKSAYTSRESVVQTWKDDPFWHHASPANYSANIVPSRMSSTPTGTSSVLYRDVNKAPDRSAARFPAPDLTKDWRSQALSYMPREREDRYLPSHREARSDSRRGSAPNLFRSGAPRDPRYGRLEDRVEDPSQRFTAKKTSGSAARGPTSTPFKRVKVERSSPPRTRPEPLTIRVPPGQQMTSASKVESEERRVANRQLYSPTTPHLTVNWPIGPSSKATEDSTSKGSAFQESPASQSAGRGARVSEPAPRGPLKRPREDPPSLLTAGEITRPEARASEPVVARRSLPAGHELDDISEGACAAGSTWTSSMTAPQNGMSSQAISNTAGTCSLPSPSETPVTANNGPLPGFFKADDESATIGASTGLTACASPSLPKPIITARLPPVTNAQKQQQTRLRSVNRHFILLETWLGGAVKSLMDGDRPWTAGQIRAETLLQGAVEELEKLKDDVEELVRMEVGDGGSGSWPDGRPLPYR